MTVPNDLDYFILFYYNYEYTHLSILPLSSSFHIIVPYVWLHYNEELTPSLNNWKTNKNGTDQGLILVICLINKRLNWTDVHGKIIHKSQDGMKSWLYHATFTK